MNCQSKEKRKNGGRKQIIGKGMLSLLICGWCFFSTAADIPQTTSFQVKTELLHGKPCKSGAEIQFKLKMQCPEEYSFRAWGAYAYLPDLPEKFCETMKLTPKKSKDPKWSAVTLKAVKWFPPKKESIREIPCAFSTRGWPAGDYKIAITTVFLPKDKKAGLPAKYPVGFIVFTLE